jgi:hypothetical protein
MAKAAVAAPAPAPAVESGASAKKKERVNRPFPSSSYQEAEAFARAAFEFASGNPVRRLILFGHLDKSPDSSASRDIITNSSKYGLTKGSYKAETLELTPDAQVIFGERASSREKAKARVALAVESIPAFAALYERFKDLKLPARAALIDAARDVGVPEEFLSQAIDTFVINLKAVGLLQSVSGAERIVTIDHMLDLLPSGRSSQATAPTSSPEMPMRQVPMTSEQAGFESTCFYVTPIGEEGSESRLHSDLFLSHIVEPALEEFRLKVVRADQIGEPGMITRQIFDYIFRSRLVVADLSFHNPNVFYELAVRHMLKKPVVQITRVGDKIPFDLNQVRTISVDNSSIYTLIPKLELYRSEIAAQVRKALEGESADNPISAYYPSMTVTFAN